MNKALQISAFLCSLVLVGCGGGGGGASSGSGNIEIPIGTFAKPTLAVSYRHSVAPNFSLAVRYLYPIDIDGDSVDELLVAGFETQPNTPQNYKNTKISIFGWDGGFKDLTSKYLPNDADKVEGVGEVVVGDFNGDGLLDVFLSAYSDMDFNVNAYQLLNKGGYFEKKVVENIIGWQHGVSAADINGDGFVDVYAAGYGASRIYLGGQNGLAPVGLPSYISGSGVALADFLGDGTSTAFIVDTGGEQDFVLARFDMSPEKVINRIEVVSNPAESLLRDKGHDIRVKAFDFDGDAKMDVMVFSREAWNGSEWPINSRVQFLKNLGGGVFSDVTETVLSGYDTKSNVAYTPVFLDMNGDGRLDIFVSESQWGASNSTSILLATSDGRYVDTARRELSSQVDANGGMATVLRGPGGSIYFVFDTQTYGGYGSLSLSQFYRK